MDFVTFIVLTLVSMLLAPKPKFPKNSGYSESEFNFPTSDESVSQKIIFGTARVYGNVIAKGDFRSNEVKKKVKVNIFKSAKQTIGYRYYLGFWIAVSGIPIKSIKKILWGDRVAWTGDVTLSNTATTDIAVNLSYKENGAEISDGLQGTFRFFNKKFNLNYPFSSFSTSGYTSIANSYMSSLVGETVPDYNNTTHAVFLGPSAGVGAGFVGSSNQMQALGFVCYREPDIKAFVGGTNNSQWLSRTVSYPFYSSSLMNNDIQVAISNLVDNTMQIGDGDVNPVWCILELLCTTQLKLSNPISAYAVDIESFMKAAERVKIDGIGVSTVLEGSESKSVKIYVDELLLLINGGLYIDTKSGKLAIRLIREDDAVEATYDNDNIIELTSFSRVVTADAVNEVTVPFVDKNNLFVERLATIQSPGLIRSAGAVNALRKEFLGVASADVASYLASRTLRTLASPLATVEFQAVREIGEVLQEGSLIELTHPTIGLKIKYRVNSYTYSGNKATITAVQDIFKSGYAFTVPAIPGSVTQTYDPPLVSSPSLDTAPYQLHGNDYDCPFYYVEAANASVTLIKPAYLTERTTWSTTLDENYVEESIQPALSGTLTTALTSTATTISIQLSATQAAMFALSLKEPDILCKVGSELISFSSTSYTLNTNTNVFTATIKRGLFDTWPMRAEAGTKVVILTGYLVDSTVKLQTRLNSAGTNTIGTSSIVYRAEVKGIDSDIDIDSSNVTEASLTVNATKQGRAVRPLVPANVRVSGAFGVTSTLDASVLVARGSTLMLTITPRTRQDPRFISYFAATSSPEDGVTYQYALDWETTAGAGNFTSNAYVNIAAGVTNLDIMPPPIVTGVAPNQTTTPAIPAGQRLIRVSIRATKTLSGSSCTSDTAVHYWTLGA